MQSIVIDDGDAGENAISGNDGRKKSSLVRKIT